MKNTSNIIYFSFFLIFCVYSQSLYAFEQENELQFDDQPVEPEIVYPKWFKQSFLDLQEDLAEAKAANKKGLIVYFGQKHCAYCLALMKNDFGQEDIANYTQKNFDVIAINIWGSKEMTLLDGQVMSERQFALKTNADLTPTLIFYDISGNQIFKLRGYYPPYEFRAALEYVAEQYYLEEPYSDYFTRAVPPPKIELSDINEQSFFSLPPYLLSRKQFKAERPLLVFFEQQNCFGCDILHSEPLEHPETKKLLKYFDSVQLDINSDEPVWTPSGDKLSAKNWAKQLGIFYTPTIIAFDEGGKEIIRIDSVAHTYRLQSILEFIASKIYINSPNYINWRFNVIFGNRKLPEF